MNVLLVGAGFWGEKVLNTLKRFKGINITVFDPNRDALNRITDEKISIIHNLNTAMTDRSIEAVFAITPPSSHFEIAKKSLENDKHVFVEKPMTLCSADACELNNLAKENGKLLHTDNTFIYTPEINFIKQVVDLDFIGKLVSLESTRSNWGPFKKDIDVVWDLMTHDISILNYIIPERHVLEGVSATGSSQVNKNVIEKARATLFYSNGFTAYVNVSFLNDVKTRKITLNGTNGLLSNDSALSKNEIFIRNNHDLSTVSYQPQQLGEPLYVEINHFFESISQNKLSLSNGNKGEDVVKILEKVSQSIQNRGQYIKVNA